MRILKTGVLRGIGVRRNRPDRGLKEGNRTVPAWRMRDKYGYPTYRRLRELGLYDVGQSLVGEMYFRQ